MCTRRSRIWLLIPCLVLGTGASGCASLQVKVNRPDTEARESPAATSPAQRERPSWWFLHSASVNTRQTFQVRDRIESGDSVKIEEDQAEFDALVLPDESGGRLVRIAPIAPSEGDAHVPGLASMWITGWARRNPDGLRVTPDRVLVHDADVLRGPWRTGDRLTVAGFAVVNLIAPYSAVGFAHLEVQSVDASSVVLRVEFWLGESGPAVRGEGRIVLENDSQGLTQARAHWRRTGEGETHAVELTITRMAVSAIE